MIAASQDPNKANSFFIKSTTNSQYVEPKQEKGQKRERIMKHMLKRMKDHFSLKGKPYELSQIILLSVQYSLNSMLLRPTPDLVSFNKLHVPNSALKKIDPLIKILQSYLQILIHKGQNNIHEYDAPYMNLMLANTLPDTS